MLHFQTMYELPEEDADDWLAFLTPQAIKAYSLNSRFQRYEVKEVEGADLAIDCVALYRLDSANGAMLDFIDAIEDVAREKNA